MAGRILKGGFDFKRGKSRPVEVRKVAPDPHSEHSHQSAFFTWLKWNERNNPALRFFYAIPNEAKRTEWERIKMLSEGMKKGVLDTHLPVARNGFTGLWIEFKKKKTGKLSPEQKEWLEFLKKEGHAVHVLNHWYEAADVTIEYLGLTDYTPISKHARVK